MRLALWAALLAPVAAMVLGLKTKKFVWNCVLTLSCAVIVALTGRGMTVVPLIAALGLSIIGDFFMAHKKDRTMWYIGGISGFLLAHIAFIWYATGRFAGNMRIYIAGAALIFMLGYYLKTRVLPKMQEKTMQIAVSLYALISGVSVIAAAAMHAPEFERLLFAVGIALIAFSDTMIAETDFVGSKECSVYIMPAYYLCHILVAASAVVGMPV